MNNLKKIVAVAAFLFPFYVFAQVDTPELISPQNEAMNVGVDHEFSWDDENTTATYTFQLSKTDDFSSSVTEATINAVRSYSPSALEVSQRYFWRVKAATDEGESDWSDANVFFTENLIKFASEVNGSSENNAFSITTDNIGNVYVTGAINGTATFSDDQILNSAGMKDIFLAKYDPNGYLAWAKRFGSSEDDEGSDIITDENGNLYLTGYFSGEVSFGSTDLQSDGFTDIFIAKLNSDGDVIWSKKAGGFLFDKGNSLGLDQSGNIYLTGDFVITATFGSNTINGAGFLDMFLAKYNSNGVAQWAIAVGSTEYDSGIDLVMNSSEQPVIVGLFTQEVTFGDGIILTSTFNDDDGEYSTDVFVAEYNGLGECQWASSGGGPGYDLGNDISADDDDNYYITGRYDLEATFGDHDLTSMGGRDMYFAKYNSTGECLYAISGGGEGSETGYGVATHDDKTYVTGYFSSTASFGDCNLSASGGEDAFFLIYDNQTGDCLNALSGGGSEDDIGWAITAGDNGFVYSTGAFEEQATFGDFTLNSEGETDIFVINPFMKDLQFFAVSVKSGWNIISSFIVPESLSIEDIFEDHTGDILIVKNARGHLYMPSLGLNTIGNWNMEEGYRVYANNDFYLMLFGEEAVPANYSIEVDQSWKYISYLRNSKMDIETALDSIIDNILIVKNSDGDIYMPSLGVNTIGNMIPGVGYSIYMNNSDELTYPDN